MTSDSERGSHRAIDRILYDIAERRDAGDFEGMAALFARSSFDTDYPDAPSGHGVQHGAAEVAENFRAMCHVFDEGGPAPNTTPPIRSTTSTTRPAGPKSARTTS